MVDDKEFELLKTEFDKLKTKVNRIEYFLRDLPSIDDYFLDIKGVGNIEDEDGLYGKAVELAVTTQKASASLFQHHLQIGYARAARLLDQLEQKSVVSSADGAAPRKVLINKRGK